MYVATLRPGQPPTDVAFDYEKLSAGHAEALRQRRRQWSWSATARPGHRRFGSSTPRPGSKIRPARSARSGCTATTSPAVLAKAEADGAHLRRHAGRAIDGHAAGPWLRTGDLGVLSDGELFIVGRIKDLLIVDGRNHYPDDIEATIQEITGGRVAAISVPDDQSERLVAIVEMKKRGSDEEAQSRLRSVRREVTSAISKSHSVRVADLVLVPPGSIPITTSGKIRRSACAECYLQKEFTRLDAKA